MKPVTYQVRLVMRLVFILLALATLLESPASLRHGTARAHFASAAVQSSNTISCGQTLTGNISVVAQQDTYTFSANAVATSGTLAARLDLNTPSRAPIGNNGFGNTSTGSLTLPVTGVYTILVRGLNLNKTGACAISLPPASAWVAAIVFPGA